MRLFMTLIRKELLHIYRDTALLLFVMYAFTVNIWISAEGFKITPERSPVGVYDMDKSIRSRELAELVRPPYFYINGYEKDYRDLLKGLDESRYVCGLVIPDGFEKDLFRGRAEVQILVDGSNFSSAYLSSLYLTLVASDFGREKRLEQIRTSPRLFETIPVVDLETRDMFNPNLLDKVFEGMNEIVMIITIMALILPASALIREIEYGTLEQLMISPLDIRKAIVAKLVATQLIILSMTIVSFAIVVQHIVGVDVKGSYGTLMGLTWVYTVAVSGLAFVVSSMAKRLNQIGLLTIMIIAPMLLISGGWVPPEALPDFMQGLTYLSPLKYFLDLVISITIRGSSLGTIYPEAIRLCVTAAVYGGLGYALFRRRLRKLGTA